MTELLLPTASRTKPHPYVRIEAIKVKNFRGYHGECSLRTGDLTLIVGRNDVGKSTLLEAAEIFFGERKYDESDLNITCFPGIDNAEISIEFSGFPSLIDLDAGAQTCLSEECLLNSRGNLEVSKIYSKTATPKIFLVADFPVGLGNLISFKITLLKSEAVRLGVPKENYNASVSSSIRRAILSQFTGAPRAAVSFDISKEPDSKKIYEKLESEFPIFTLFSADRKNTDQDDEVQAPIKASIKEMVASLQAELEPIRRQIEERIDQIAHGTAEKLREMNPEVARSLRSIIEKPAWERAFTVNFETDNVPLNKRGSGVKRLILINFFRQEADRRRFATANRDIFYAVEEPETSQHPDWQGKLMEAFKALAEEDGVQIAMTSHHPELSGFVPLSDIRLVERSEQSLSITEGNSLNYRRISKTLGVLPRVDGVRVVVAVEGPNDITFLRNIAHHFNVRPDTEEIMWIPMGGATLRDYVENGYLTNLEVPKVYFFDRDPDSQYQNQVEKLRSQGGWAKLTGLLMIENYLHPRHYSSIWPQMRTQFVNLRNSEWLGSWSERDLPRELGTVLRTEHEDGNSELIDFAKSKIKKRFAEAAKHMTTEDFDEMGTRPELHELFTEIRRHISA